MTVEHDTPRRAVRADAGLIRATERDLRLLAWVGEQYAISIPQLAVLMGRSEHAARWLRARWQRAGWAEGRLVLIGRPVFVWLTREGSRVASLSLKPWVPNAGSLAHIEAVNDVRLLVAARRPEAKWTSERDLPFRTAPGVARAHRPDAVVTVEGGRRVAVEVELTLKSRARLERIVGQLLGEFDAVWYFAAPTPRRALDEIAARAGHRLHVTALPGEES
jgi:hypothetical protein